MEETLRSLQNEENRIVGSTNVAVRFVSEGLSGANFKRDVYHLVINDARKKLSDAREALARGDQKSALRFLQTADERIRQADSFWNQYVGTSLKGSKRAVAGLATVAVGATVAATGGFGALALGAAAAAGLAAGGIAYLKLLDEDEISTASMHRLSKTVDEPDVSTTQPEEVKTQLPRSKYELINEAKERLTKWSECKRNSSKSCDLPSDIGSFLIESETVGSGERIDADLYTAMQEKWGETARTVSEAAKGEEGNESVQSLMDALHDKYLKFYVKKNALLSNFIKSAGGNCVAETQLILSSMAATGIRLKSSQTFGVQVFKDHVQAVIYDRETGEIWDLLNDIRTREINAPIYDPHLLYYSYLNNQGTTSPVKYEELLIARSNKQKSDFPILHVLDLSGLGFQNLRFPGGSGFYNTAPIPERAILSRHNSHSTNSATFKMTDQIHHSPDKLCIKHSLTAISFEDLFEKDRKHWESALPDGMNFTQDSTIWPGPIFRTAEDARHFNSLPTVEAKTGLLFQLVNQSIAARLDTPRIKRAFEIASDPNTARKYSAKEIRETALAGMHVFVIASTATGVIGRFPFVSKKSESLIYRQVLSQNITLSILQNKLSNLLKRIENRPLEFLQLMNEFPHDKRKAFFDFVRYYITERQGQEWTHLPAVFNALANRQLVGVGTQSGRVQATYVKIDLNISDLERKQDTEPKTHPKGAVAGPIEQPRQKGPENKRSDTFADDSDAVVRISAECMIDLIFEYGDADWVSNRVWEGKPSVCGRWSPGLSNEFMRLNKDGRYDNAFLQNYGIIASQYPDELKKKNHDAHNCPTPEQTFDDQSGAPCKIPEDIKQIRDDINRRKGHLADNNVINELMNRLEFDDLIKELGGNENALRILDNIIKSNPANKAAHLNRGSIFFERGEYKKAFKANNRAVELNPKNAHARTARGAALGALKQYKDALRDFDKAIELDPNYAPAHAMRGLSLYFTGHCQEALKAINHAIQLDPKLPKAHKYQAIVLEYFERYDEALKAYDRAIQLNSNYETAIERRDKLLEKLKALNTLTSQ